MDSLFTVRWAASHVRIHLLLICVAATVLMAVTSAVAVAAEGNTLSPRRLLEVTDLSAPTISPNGRQVAFRSEQPSVERNDYDCFWFVQSLGGGTAPVRVASCGTLLRNSAGEVSTPPVQWSPDGRWIYFLAMRDGRVDVWRAAADGSGAFPVTQDAADVREFRLHASGQLLDYRVGAERERVLRAEADEYSRGIRIDASVPLGQNLFRSGTVDGRPATQRLGEWFDRVLLLHDAPSRWVTLDVETGEVRPGVNVESPGGTALAVVAVTKPGAHWQAASEPDGTRTAVLTRVGDGRGLLEQPDVQLSVLHGAVQSPQVCDAVLCVGQQITGIQWRPGSDDVVYTVTDPARGMGQALFVWNVRADRVTEVARSDGLLSGGRARSSPCGLSQHHLVCVAADARRPPRLVQIDLESGLQDVLFDPNVGLAHAIANGPEIRLLQWQDDHGRAFTGQLYLPKAEAGRTAPLFINYYLCIGFVRGGVGDEWPLLSFAEQGIAALCINAAPYQLDARERYDAGLSAVRGAVQLLASEGIVDPARVGMGGLSFGAETTFWTLMHSDLLTAASVASPGISTQYYRLGSLMGERFHAGLQSYWQLGAPDETQEQWKLIAPDLNLDKLKAPILMQLPEQEFMHSVDYAVPLSRANRADVYVFPHEPHQKFQPRHKMAAYERNLDWFRFWLKGHEDQAVGKRTQYDYWRRMRTHPREEHAATSP